MGVVLARSLLYRSDMQTNAAQSIASIIREQIGIRAIFMMGASCMLDHGDGLGFKVSRNPRGVSHVKVTLAGDDTYTVRFSRYRTVRRTMETIETVISEEREVYAEDLHRVLNNGTGLYLSL